jgi:hypothetical protein
LQYDGSFASLTDLEIENDERVRLMSERKKKTNHAVYSNFTSPGKEGDRNKRHSLPIINNSTKANVSSTRSERLRVIKPITTTTIDEIEEFENNHCKDLEDFSEMNPATPPRKFYRHNSEPFDDGKGENRQQYTTSSSKKPTPRRLMGRNMLRRNKGKAPQPPLVSTPKSEASESVADFGNGNFKHYDLSSASVGDEFVISSKSYKGKMKKERANKVNSVGESAGSGSSLSSESERNAMRQRRQSPPYQTVINKHGDEVEYALPYNERDSMQDIPPLPEAPIPSHFERYLSYDHIIDQNFKFLNTRADFFQSQIESDPRDAKASNNTIVDPIDASFSDAHRQNLQVTDLDRSNDTSLLFPHTGDVLKDLDSLAKWTENYRVNDKEHIAHVEPVARKANSKGIKTIDAKDLRYKPGSLRNSFSTPLEFSNGYFHKTPITLRSTLPNNYNISNFADIACMREFETLW